VLCSLRQVFDFVTNHQFQFFWNFLVKEWAGLVICNKVPKIEPPVPSVAKSQGTGGFQGRTSK